MQDNSTVGRPGMLEGKAIVITGSGRGLGAAYAHLAAREGASVVVNGVDGAVARAVAEAICAEGGKAVAHPGDISTWDAACGLIDSCVEAFGRIDAVCNNAAVFTMATPFDEDPETFRRTIEVNLMGTAFVGMAAARAMKAQGTGGAILNTVSGAQSGLLEMAAYGASKGGIASLTYNWAMDMAPHGIRVNAISPRAATRSAQVVHPDTNKGMPPEGVAPLAVYLLSDLSSRFTGQVFMAVDGEVALMSHPAITTPSVWMPGLDPFEVGRVVEAGLADHQLPLGRSVQKIEILSELGATMNG
ncbi:SDR family NAD(P)-dependent oxidoreductase [Novosphingobium cyanobacteriorum]|uniref:SDR family NAD(P)-dependent oxidoreductase n=1 Tax=Novosphingobium cyanobacteriorum TaxID=3024215 RepID=A0ABT6CN05_9SPHN|nr:SDR family oxidoreductase [Novosphingobium cyanobacteriorum]MDF8334958.1 SDR family NAD(P)-dependent oxidoreductase [Novosphingobium cyanobacteriorum]